MSRSIENSLLTLKDYTRLMSSLALSINYISIMLNAYLQLLIKLSMKGVNQ